MLNTILLQAQTGGSMYSTILMFVAMGAIFYFFMIRPQSKKQKEIKKFRDSMQKGQKVVTAGGIYGKIREINESTLLLEIADNVKITIDKAYVFPSAQDAVEAGVKS